MSQRYGPQAGGLDSIFQKGSGRCIVGMKVRYGIESGFLKIICGLARSTPLSDGWKNFTEALIWTQNSPYSVNLSCYLFHLKRCLSW